MSKKHIGRVYTVCPECGIELKLTDPHQFDEYGNIIN